MVLIGAGALIAVVILLTGGNAADLIAIVGAFGLGAILPSPVERTSE